MVLSFTADVAVPVAPASVKASHKTPVASKKQPVVTTDVVLVEPSTGGAGVDMPADGTAAAVAGPGTPRRLSLDFSDPLAAMQKKHSIFKTHYQTAVSKSTGGAGFFAQLYVMVLSSRVVAPSPPRAVPANKIEEFRRLFYDAYVCLVTFIWITACLFTVHGM